MQPIPRTKTEILSLLLLDLKLKLIKSDNGLRTLPESDLLLLVHYERKRSAYVKDRLAQQLSNIRAFNKLSGNMSPENSDEVKVKSLLNKMEELEKVLEACECGPPVDWICQFYGGYVFETRSIRIDAEALPGIDAWGEGLHELIGVEEDKFDEHFKRLNAIMAKLDTIKAIIFKPKMS
jgi:hypothetical protein